MVDGTYDDTKNMVLCVPGVSGEFKVNVGLTQGAHRCGGTGEQEDLYKNVLRKLLHADDRQQ